MPAIEPIWIDYLLVGANAVLLPVIGAIFLIPRILKRSPHELDAMRPRIYWEAMSSQWLFAAAALHVVVFRGYPLEALGLVVPEPEQLIHGALLLAALLVVVVFQRRRIMNSETGDEQVREALGRVHWLIPRTQGQRRLWWLVSAHAGIAEELFYRGYVFALMVHFMPVWAAALGSSLLFGLAHAYQGARGIVMTAILGGVLYGLYAVSGSLWIPMLAHALYDIHAGELGYWAFTRDAGRDDTP